MTSPRRWRRRGRAVAAMSAGAMVVAGLAVTGAQAADTADGHGGPEFHQTRPVAPGVHYQSFEMFDDAGDRVEGSLLKVNLKNPNVSLDLLYPGVVSARQPLTALADNQGAVAGVNGDFFDVGGTSETDGSNAPVGPAVAGGKDLTGAVPLGQRWGPPLAPETTTVETVFGVSEHGGHVAELSLEGKIATPAGVLELDALNQYAIKQGGIGVFTPDWGVADRKRATCGTDTVRNAPCSEETIEVVVADNVVTEVHDEPRAGAIAENSFVLVGREAGTGSLEQLVPGDPVELEYGLVPDVAAGFDFAIGGTPILRGGQPLAGLQMGVREPRTAAGASADGATVYMVTIDGRQEHSVGISIHDLAVLMGDLGADSAVNLDGGGSTTMVARERGSGSVSVVNSPSGGQQTPVPNGIGVFSR